MCASICIHIYVHVYVDIAILDSNDISESIKIINNSINFIWISTNK